MPDIKQLRERMRTRMPQATAGRSWYSISNATDGAAVVRIYDEISWWGVSADQFIHDLDGITTDRIRVEINSPGGDVFDAVAIYNALRVHPAHVTTRVDGLAASAASLIVQAGDHRVMLSSAQMMIHNAWGIAIGNADEHREMATLLDQQDDVIAGIYANRSGGDRQEFRTLMAAETWLTDAETVERGLADEVIDPPRRDAPENRGETLHDQISRAMDVVSGAVNSAERVGALRAEKGKSLSQVNRDSVGALVDHLERLKALLDADEPQPDPSAAQREFLRNVARRVTVSS